MRYVIDHIYFHTLKYCDEGGMNSGHLWKLKKKISPSAKAIEDLAVETYTKRLENRKMRKKSCES